MCPICISTTTLLVAGATFTGGLTALTASQRARTGALEPERFAPRTGLGDVAGRAPLAARPRED